MFQQIYTLPIVIFSSAYGTGSYGCGSYNDSVCGSSTNQSSGSSTSAKSATSTTTATPTQTVQILKVDNSSYSNSNSVVENVSTQPSVSGLAPANSQILITIQPNSVTCKTTSDAQGNWTCKFNQTISPGMHSVSVQATTPQGNLITSPTFEINATAVSYITNAPQQNTTQNHPANSNSATFNIIIFVIIGLILLAGLFIFLKRRKKKKNETPPTTFVPPTTPNNSPQL